MRRIRIASWALLGLLAASACGNEPQVTSALFSAEGALVPCDATYDPGLVFLSSTTEWHLEIGESTVPRVTTDVALYVEGRAGPPYALYRTGWGSWKVVSGQGAFPIRRGTPVRLVAFGDGGGLAAEYGWAPYLDQAEPPLLPCGDEGGCTPSCEAGTCGDDGCGGTCACPDGEVCESGTCAVPTTPPPPPAASCSWDPALEVTSRSSEWHMEISEGFPLRAAELDLYVQGANGGAPYAMYATGWGTWKVVSGQGALPIPFGWPIRFVARDDAGGSASYGWFGYLQDAPALDCADGGGGGGGTCTPSCDGTTCGGDGCGGTCSCASGLVCESAVCVSAGDALRVLFIGNSFTEMGPVPDCFFDLAVDAGHPAPDVHMAAEGGTTLSHHRADPGTVAMVDRGGWDVVVLQEYSLRPTDSAGSPWQFKADATWFYDRIKARSPSARVVLYETWARHPSNSIYPGTFSSFQDMQSQLRHHYQDAASRYIPTYATAARRHDASVAPVGDVWEFHLFGSWTPLPLYDDFGYHADPLGQYLNALVIYKTVYGDSDTVGMTNWCGWYGPSALDAGAVRILQQDADAFMGSW